MTKAVLAALARIAGPDISCAVEPVTDDAGLLPGEEASLTRAIPTRRAEFAAGRRAARRAIGDGTATIAVAADRAPVWPKGILGSIAHDDGLAIVTVARAGVGLGVDLTGAEDLPEETRAVILTAPSETRLTGPEAKAVFAIKEAIFKALYPRVGDIFDFDAVAVAPDFATETFTARLTCPIGPFPSSLRMDGGLALVEGRIIALLHLRSFK
jgi:4'-phosphopantetheinyl transferase EntD